MHINGHVSAYALRLMYKRVQSKYPEIDNEKYVSLLSRTKANILFPVLLQSR